MKTLKKLALLPLFCGLLLTSACSDDENNGNNNPFVGTWRHTYPPGYIEAIFRADKTYQFFSSAEGDITSRGIYSFSESARTITLVETRSNYSVTWPYEFVNANTLVLTAYGENMVFNRQ